MNKKICDKLFFVISIILIFVNIPEFIEVKYIGSIVADKLIFYPLFIGLIYTIYCQYKYKNVLIDWDKFKRYILIFWLVILISTILGLIIYPYYDVVLNGPMEQIEKLSKVLAVLNSLGIYIEEKYLVMFWMITKAIKTVCLDTIYTFGGTYMIYCWYHDRAIEGFKILTKATIISAIIIVIYGIIDMFYLLGSNIATNILIILNPLLHLIKDNDGWWPPLLWNGQLRSIFAEPSFYGIYASFAMPFLWYKFVKTEKVKYKAILLAIIFGFTFCLFLTKARTAVALFSGEFVILVLYMLYLRRKMLWSKIIIIFTVTVIAFFSANIVIANMGIWQNTEKENIVDMQAYLEDNLGSLASIDKRSNTARYSTMIAKFKIGIDYPLLGVGTTLTDAYMPEYFPAMSEDNYEINMWLNNQKEKGILKSGFPNLGEYTTRFAQNGLIGLFLFLIPPMILLVNLIRKIRTNYDNEDMVIKYLFFSISFIGVMAAGIGDSINITYCYWVLLGLGYAMCFGKHSIK